MLIVLYTCLPDFKHSHVASFVSQRESVIYCDAAGRHRPIHGLGRRTEKFLRKREFTPTEKSYEPKLIFMYYGV